MADEHWLDNNANFVNEEKIIELLENASDYGHRLEQLNTQQKTLVEKLKELGGDVKNVMSNKRKHMSYICCKVELNLI